MAEKEMEDDMIILNLILGKYSRTPSSVLLKGSRNMLQIAGKCKFWEWFTIHYEYG
jgi:hypothetical protein